MLLGRLQLQDFLIFKDVDIDLSEVSLASIIGTFVADKRRSNGSGKSAFVEAIRYILFDQTRSKSKLGIVREGQPRAVAELEFKVGGNTIRVRRVRSSAGTSTANCWVNGQASGDKVKVVNGVVCHHLGVDADLFDLIYFFKQGDQFGFAEARPTERKEILAKVFKMDSLARCQDSVAAKLRAAREAKQRADGVCEAANSRISGMWSVVDLAEKELAAGGDVATAEQLFNDYNSLGDETTASLNEFITKAEEWRADVVDDRTKAHTLESVILSASNSIGSLEGQLQQQQSQHNSLKSEYEAAKSDCVEPDGDKESFEMSLSTLKSQLNDASVQSSTQYSMANRIESEFKMQSLAGQECPTCGQDVGVDHVEKAIAEVNRKAADFRKSGDAHKTVASEIDKKIVQLVANVRAHDAYRVKIDNVILLKGNLAHSATSMRHIADRVADQVSERNRAIGDQNDLQMSVDLDLCESTDKSLKVHERNLASLKGISDNRSSELFNDIGVLSFQHSCAEKNLEARMGADIDLEIAESKRIAADKEVRIWQALAEAFGKNGIQALIIENTLGSIESFANDMLKQMQTRFIIQLRTQKQLKTGEERESLDIVVYDNGSERPFENYSGGERTLINLALRLSLSRVIGSLHGVKMQSLFLDEVLGALDAVNREEVVKVVAFLSRSFEQVFVISHTDEVKDIIDTGIIIERHDHHSEVRLTHGTR